jgi:hypothetical protein
MRPQSILVALIIGLLDQVVTAQVVWRTGDRLPDAMAPAAVREKAAAWRVQHAQGGPRERHVLIQFGEPITPGRKDLLAGRGVQLLQPLGGNAFFATIDASRIDAADLQQNHRIAGLRDIERNWKLHPKLIASETPPWSVVSRKADGQAPDVLAGLAASILTNSGFSSYNGNGLG